MNEPRITVDPDQTLDEFVASNVNVHFEAMSDCSWWIGVTDPATGRSWSINVGSTSGRARGYAHVEEQA